MQSPPNATLFARVQLLAPRIAYAACLAMPVALLHARALAEILIASIDILFLLRCAAARDWAWARSPFAVAALLWWAWVVVCSGLGTGGLLVALLAIRLPVFALAVNGWVLGGAEADTRRRALWWMLAAGFAWIALECWQQALLGTNLFGATKYFDGALTGPFTKPRAGPALILLFFPVVVPASVALLQRTSIRARAAGGAVAMGAALTMVMIGQRMPTALMVLGFGFAGLLVPRLRVAAAGALGAGATLVILLPWLSPGTFAKLVSQTSDQLSHFAQSNYGLIFTHAWQASLQHPWFGQGFDTFRRLCPHEGPGCNIHPHNYYLEALVNAGFPGLTLFAALAATAVSRTRGGVLIGLIVAYWPLASTSAFTSMPNAGWVFLLVGMGRDVEFWVRDQGAGKI
jgi:hypothetical protein